MHMSRGGQTCQPTANCVLRWASPNVSSFGCRRKNIFLSDVSIPTTTLQLNRMSVIGCSIAEGDSEPEGVSNEQRLEESGKEDKPFDGWRWTLNWDHITDNIVLGSCPRIAEDLERIAREAGATAVLSLQSDLCLEAMGVNWEVIRAQGANKGVVMARVPIRDFDQNEQILMLPEAVRALGVLLALNKRVYVHCTAGMNRAALAVLGYLTFVEGWELLKAVDHIQKQRPQAHPSVESWTLTKARLLRGRTEEVTTIALGLSKKSTSEEIDSFANWIEAETQLIKDTYKRQVDCSLSLISALAAANSLGTSQGNSLNGGRAF